MVWIQNGSNAAVWAKAPKKMRFENEKHIQQSLVFRFRTRVCFEKDANSNLKMVTAGSNPALG